MSAPDKRLHAYREDLTDIRLKGQVEAARFIEGVPAQCGVPVAGVFKTPADDAMQLTQMLLGESLLVFERRDGWCWVQLSADDYVGYVREAALREAASKPTRKVTALLSHLYPKPDIKSQPAISIPMNAELVVTGAAGDFLSLAPRQYIFAAHVGTEAARDFVAVAERFLHTPYLWGGKTAIGIDCSGLVQVSLQAAGIDAPRDSDMQEKGLGVSIPRNRLKRGDLAFWKGHVGIMLDAKTLLHANGHHMMVVSEPLDVVAKRAAAKGSDITAIKRL